MESKRVAIYARVSTADQSTENQSIDLRRYAGQRGWIIAKEYVDHGFSGTKDSRPALDVLMADARRRRFDVVLVWKFDRFARSARHLLVALDQFNGLGIDFVSVQDAVDTSSAYGKAMFTIIAAMAELEREIIRQRVLNGVQKAKERGVTLGRPKATVDLAAILAMKDDGQSVREIAAQLSVGKSTIAKLLSENHPSIPPTASVGVPRRFLCP